MRLARLHGWPRTVRGAIALQQQLAPQVRLCPITSEVRLLAGTDVAFSRAADEAVAGVVVWDALSALIVEQRLARRPCRFPYVPGLLAFRELPALLAAFRQLQARPDAVLCDAQGLAHPRRFGLACHLGLWLNLPTIGCAKSRLCGTSVDPPGARGGTSPLLLDGQQVGVVLRTRDGVRPVFVSPGHLCDHASAVRVVLAATPRYRLPEPTRRAHRLVGVARQHA